MSEQTPHVRAAEPDRSGPPEMPRWVKIAGMTGIGGDHGPGRHLSQMGTTLVAVSAASPGGAWA